MAFRTFSSKIFASKLNATKLATAIGFGTASGFAGYSFFQDRQNGAKSFLTAEAEPVIQPSKFTDFELKEVKAVNHNTSIFRFALPEEQSLELPVASCIVTGFTGEDGKLITRPYTPISPSDQKGSFDLIIKKYAGGPMSSFIFSLQPGDKLQAKGPFAKLAYTANMKKNIGMIAGGTGIAPMIQVLNKILADPSDTTSVSLLFANITPEDILLKDQLDALSAQHPRFKVFYTLDKAPADWTQGRGFISREMIEGHLPPPSSESLIFVCGPNPMLAHVSGLKGENFTQGTVGGLLKELNYDETMVYKF